MSVDPELDADDFMAAVQAVVARAPALSPLDAGLLVALGHGVIADTRAFAKAFGIAHALALRAASELAEGAGYVEATARDPRTQRTRLTLTESGRRLLAGERTLIAA
ncbi:hypothetical protein [Hansschlegelia sp. KR7-227]|uniref:hypothetical protein n=1 Tax=Hansschlegelia sp. KR7-227 TaxID=3400914 RepID=UPI003C04836C